MEELAETEAPIVVCGYAPQRADEPRKRAAKQRRKCTPEMAKCREGDPARVWAKSRYSVCGKKGAECPCYLYGENVVTHHEVTGVVFRTMLGYREMCQLYGFDNNKSRIWDYEERKAMLKRQGIDK